MANTYAEVIDAIADINAGIPGLQAAYNSTNLPSTLTVFPCAFTLLGPDEYGGRGPTPCEYWIKVFVAPVVNSNPSIAYQNCLALSQAFHDTYNRISHVGDTFLMRMHLTIKLGFGSTGFSSAMKWGADAYYGFQVNVPLAQRTP